MRSSRFNSWRVSILVAGFLALPCYADIQGSLHIKPTARTIDLTNEQGETIGRASFKDVTFSYEFFTLMGTPCQFFRFDHELDYLRLAELRNGRGLFIRSGVETKIDLTRDTLWLAPEEFNRLKVSSFDFELSYGLGLKKLALFSARFPGYVMGQNRGSYDVPAAKEWGAWIHEPAPRIGLRSSELSPYMDAAKAKAAYVTLEKLHQGRPTNFQIDLRLSAVRFNRAELAVILARHNLTRELYGPDSEASRYAALLSAFAEGAGGPEEQREAFRGMKALGARLKLSAEYDDLIEEINRGWFNDYVAQHAPLNFGSEDYADPGKMSKLLAYYQNRLGPWLGYSDIGFDFALAVPVSFSLVARRVERTRRADSGEFHLTNGYTPDRLVSREELRRRERARAENKRREEEKKRRAWREGAREEAASSKELHEKTCAPFFAEITYGGLVSAEESTAALDARFADKIDAAKRSMELPNLLYHKWKIEIEWNLPE